MARVLTSKSNQLFIILGSFFIANALIAEFIGVKIFSLEALLGIDAVSWSLLGESNLSFSLTAGVILWPVVFIMTDIINEYFGIKGVRWLSFLAAGLIAYAFVMVYFSIGLPAAEWWIMSEIEGVPINRDHAFAKVFGQGLWIIVGSLVAFLIGQVSDVFTFHAIKRKTGESKVWLRATGSTLVSQLIDSFVVLFIAFYIGDNWSLGLVLAVGIVNYVYKFSMAIILTPVIYLAHTVIDHWLGQELAMKLKTEAMGEK